MGLAVGPRLHPELDEQFVGGDERARDGDTVVQNVIVVVLKFLDNFRAVVITAAPEFVVVHSIRHSRLRLVHLPLMEVTSTGVPSPAGVAVAESAGGTPPVIVTGIVRCASLVAVPSGETRIAIAATVRAAGAVAVAGETVAVDVAFMAEPIRLTHAEPVCTYASIMVAIVVSGAVALVGGVADAMSVSAETVIAHHVPGATVADTLTGRPEALGDAVACCHLEGEEVRHSLPLCILDAAPLRSVAPLEINMSVGTSPHPLLYLISNGYVSPEFKVIMSVVSPVVIVSRQQPVRRRIE
jgi:hypothetical protein